MHKNAYCRIDSFGVLRQSFCGKFKLSAGSGSQGSQLLERMNECDFSSVRTGDLKMHMMAHREQKAHKCNICDYSSSQVSNLRSHIKKHIGNI